MPLIHTRKVRLIQYLDLQVRVKIKVEVEVQVTIKVVSWRPLIQEGLCLQKWSFIGGASFQRTFIVRYLPLFP